QALREEVPEQSIPKVISVLSRLAFEAYRDELDRSTRRVQGGMKLGGPVMQAQGFRRQLSRFGRGLGKKLAAALPEYLIDAGLVIRRGRGKDSTVEFWHQLI